MDAIAPLVESIPAIIENVVNGSQGKSYFDEFGAEKANKIRSMSTELLESMIGYLKTASLAHAKEEMKTFQINTPSTDAGVELKALWADIIQEAALLNPNSKKLLQQLQEVFDRLINECMK